jgi:hypothetical protein
MKGDAVSSVLRQWAGIALLGVYGYLGLCLIPSAFSGGVVEIILGALLLAALLNMALRGAELAGFVDLGKWMRP